MAAGVSPRTCRRLMTIPGVGQLTALAFVAAIDDHQLDTWAVAIVQKSSPTRASPPTPLTFETSQLPANQVKADWPRNRPDAATRNARAGALEFLVVSTGRGTGWPQRRAGGGARRGSRGSIFACARGHWISTSTGTCKKQEFIAENHSGWGLDRRGLAGVPIVLYGAGPTRSRKPTPTAPASACRSPICTRRPKWSG